MDRNQSAILANQLKVNKAAGKNRFFPADQVFHYYMSAAYHGRRKNASVPMGPAAKSPALRQGGAVRAAADLGFQVIVAEDACATRDLNYDDTVIPADLVHKSFLAALKSYGKVMKSEEILALLAGGMVK